MELSEAVDITGRMRHFFRAFEKLEEVLIMISQYENSIPEMSKRKEEIAQLDELILQKKKEVSENISLEGVKFEEFSKDIQSKKSLLLSSFESQKNELESKLINKIKQVETEIALLTKKSSDAIDEYEQLVSGHKNSIKQLDLEIEVREKRLIEINKDLDNIKSRI